MNNKEKFKTKSIRFRSVAEKTLEILGNVKAMLKDKLMAEDITWCIEMIANNKINEIVVEVSNN